MGNWRSRQRLSDVRFWERVGAGEGLVLGFWWCMPKKGLGGSQEGLAGAGMGAQQTRLGSP